MLRPQKQKRQRQTQELPPTKLLPLKENLHRQQLRRPVSLTQYSRFRKRPSNNIKPWPQRGIPSSLPESKSSAAAARKNSSRVFPSPSSSRRTCPRTWGNFTSSTRISRAPMTIRRR
ncbi:MAG TPA: hypothetical protein EYG15_13145 [Deltaproteobacteria bacterium]|nr:hypothetical protein [Deltaproteobacteria bacterium]